MDEHDAATRRKLTIEDRKRLMAAAEQIRSYAASASLNVVMGTDVDTVRTRFKSICDIAASVEPILDAYE